MDLEQAIARRELIVSAMQRLMKEGVDYGKIPGTERPTLLQPGADKLCNLFGLVIKYEVEVCEEDWIGERHGGEPFFYYKVRGYAFRGDFLIGEGVGSCNSWESKYRWRTGEHTCPACGKPNIRKSRSSGEGWYCWRKTDGCGATFEENDAAITCQPVGRKANPDMADVVNTVLKIAFKPTKVLTTINGTSASEFFTQDVEDFTPPPDDIDTGGHRLGTSQAAQYVAEQKIASGNAASKAPWKSMGEMAEAFRLMRERVGENAWRQELERWGWTSFQDLRNAIVNNSPKAKEKAVECYWTLDALNRKGDQ
jgi:hypothetical protein